MVKLQLFFKADLENIESVEANRDIDWSCKVKCTSCGEENEKFVIINEDEKQEISGSRGEANLVIRCKMCKRENNIDIVPGSRKAYTTGGKFGPILQFECRGAEIVAIELQDSFKATTESGKKFDVNFADGDWTEYDDTAQVSVGIYSPETKIEKTK